MSNQQKPDRSTQPQPGHAAADSSRKTKRSGGTPEKQPKPAKLETLVPRRRKPTRRAPSRTNPFEKLFGSPPVDLDSLRHALATGQIAVPDDHLTYYQRLNRRIHSAPSFLVSMVIHLAIFLILALTVFSIKKPTPTISIFATISAKPVLENPVDVETETVEIVLPDQNQSPVEMIFEDTSTDELLTPADTTNVVPNVVVEEISPVPNPAETVPSPIATLPTGGGMEGREISARARLAASRGGSRASEAAVERGLQWILAHQRDDGSWHFYHDWGQCNGACGNQGTQESTTAATGLALMSLLGAGYTHRTGPYREQIQKGLDFLTQKMRITQLGGSLLQGEAGMYSHGIATIALSEAYIMTRDTGLVRAVKEARKYIVTAQHQKGGWRYIPGTRGDMTVTGWQIMALKSCELAGFKTDESVWKNAASFVDSLGSSSGSFGYQKPEEDNRTTTAIGVLSKMYLGANLENQTLELGTQIVADGRPSATDIYFNYYATQILYHRHDEFWPKWNQEIRDYLVKTQDLGNTHRAGSWYFPDKHGKVGGRLYTTAMAVMTLEVYYRYMPLYDKRAIQEPVSHDSNN